MKTPEMIQVDKLKTFENHPYKVEENEEMEMLTQSIKENGILSPLIVRPIENSEYEIISGHRRLFASKRAGLTEVPAFVYEMDRDKAIIALVDSNLHREHLLPSEKAFAYKMKVEAMNRQGERTDLTCSQVGKRLNTYEVIAEESGESRNQIHRYIRLTNLLPELLKYVDDGQISFTPAVELSFLNDIEQRDLLQAMELNDCTPSLSQAVRMKKLSQAGKLDDDRINKIMAEEKANQKERIKIPTERVRKYFPKSFSNSQIEDEIVKLCEVHYKRRQRQQER
ncbi:MAG: ParB/RepB/Spo0J family partition protein [Clostridia bacterium]|nr:ParB/RepB/Spo0J family partition protein [Clostridia bacterium]MEE1050111.1 ParB/RepB/Spo0J family partition protein [Clostridia bacterium]